eukprot:9493905-Heterocapsa_arctica.AAC.1
MSVGLRISSYVLVCTLSVVFPQFGIHKLSHPDESIADLMRRYDLDAIARYDCAAIHGEAGRAHSFAMPCNTIIPTVSGVATPDPGLAPFK